MAKKETQNVIHRSSTNRYIAGVAGGLGEYFHIDSTLIRIVFVLLTIFGGSGIILYILLWLLLPSDTSINNPKEHIQNNINEMKERAKSFAHDIHINRTGSGGDSKAFWGVIIIILGVLFLLDNYGVYNFINLARLWPVILIVIGLSILSRQ